MEALWLTPWWKLVKGGSLSRVYEAGPLPGTGGSSNGANAKLQQALPQMLACRKGGGCLSQVVVALKGRLPRCAVPLPCILP